MLLDLLSTCVANMLHQLRLVACVFKLHSLGVLGTGIQNIIYCCCHQSSTYSCSSDSRGDNIRFLGAEKGNKREQSRWYRCKLCLYHIYFLKMTGTTFLCYSYFIQERNKWFTLLCCYLWFESNLLPDKVIAMEGCFFQNYLEFFSKTDPFMHTQLKLDCARSHKSDRHTHAYSHKYLLGNQVDFCSPASAD